MRRDDPTQSDASVDAPTDHVLTQEDVLAAQLDHGLDELRRPLDGLLLSGVSAGLDIGFGHLPHAVAGNAVGGSVFVALLKYGYVVRGRRE